MGQYKVPQDVEAEDKILGPLTFRQFIYALIGAGWGIICFALFRAVPALLAVVGFPPTMLFLLLAFYKRDGQNFEQILIAMVGFFAASRRRVWVKDPVAETFHIEPTKRAAEVTQRNPEEVISELEKLATLVDSRGWNEPPQPETHAIFPSTPNEDRMVAPPPAPHAPDMPKTDMMDMQHSPLAQNLSELLRQAAEDVREEAMQQMNTPKAKAPAALANAQSSITGVTPQQPNDIVKLATQNDDLSVSQIAAQATRLVPPPNAQPVETQPSAS